MQIKNEQILTLIPARMQATRLPGKPMLEIEGKPMIWHVWQQAVRAELGPVCVATDSAEIAAYITDSGGRAILTDPALPSAPPPRSFGFRSPCPWCFFFGFPWP